MKTKLIGLCVFFATALSLVVPQSNGSLFAAQATKLCVPPPAGLTSWWPGDGNADDIAGGNNGTLMGGVTFAPGKVGQAFSFNGVDGFVEIPHASNLNVTSQLSIDAWIKPDTVSVNHRIVGKGGWTPHEDFILVLVGDRLRFGLASLGGGSTEIDSFQTIAPGVWTHIAATFDGSVMRMYVDGVQDTTTGSHGTIAPGVSRAWIGMSPDSGLLEVFDGLIDEVEIYNRALSTTEIQAIFTAGSAGKCKFVNDFVAFKPIPSTYLFTTDTTGCPAGCVGTFSFDARLTNISEHDLANLEVEIAEITDGNLLLTEDGLLGEGERFRVPQRDGFTDARLTQGEWVDVPFAVCLQKRRPFRLVVNVLGGTPPSCVAPPSGMVGWWPLDETEGDRATDLVGGNHGVYIGTPTPVPGLVSGAFGFSGIDDGVFVESIFPFHHPGDATLDFWLKSPIIAHQSVFWTRADDDDLNRFNIYVGTHDGASTFGFDYREPDGTLHILIGDSFPGGVEDVPILRNAWNHLAIARTHDAISGADTYNLYVNGKFAARAVDAAPRLPTAVGWQAAFRMGYLYEGYLDEVELFDRALSASEIQAIFNAGSAGKCKDGAATEVRIDIKPGSSPNTINPRSKGVIPVAILTTREFDATTVDPLSVKFGPDGATEAHGRGHREDVNGDGKKDLMLHFRTQETGIRCGDTTAFLTGATFDRVSIGGSESIRTEGCK